MVAAEEKAVNAAATNHRPYYTVLTVLIFLLLGIIALKPRDGSSAHELAKRLGGDAPEELPGMSSSTTAVSGSATDAPVLPTPTSSDGRRNYTIPPNEVLCKKHKLKQDPAFECTYRNWRWTQTSFMTGYLVNRNDRFTNQLGSFRPSIRLTDYGCFTGYTIHGNGVLWTAVHEETGHNQHRITLGADPVTGEVFDVASSKFTYMWYCAAEFSDDRLGNVMQKISERLVRQHGPTAQAWLQGNFDFQPIKLPDESLGHGEYWQSPGNLGSLTYIPGAAFIAPVQFGKFIGQAFQQYMTFAARFWSTGAMLEGNATMVVARPYDARWRPLFDWLFDLAPGGGMFVELDNAIYAKTAHFATPAGWEHPDPCVIMFNHKYLLPTVRAKLRRDPTFEFGDQAVRADATKSDEAWANTLPKKIAIIKNPKNSRAGDRAFIFDEKARQLILSEGYVLVEDTAPILHRMLLINHAEVLTVTYGALMVMMLFLWGRLDQPYDKRLRVIALVNRWYDEEGYYAPDWKREGMQDGMRIVINKDSIFQVPGVWTKFVVWHDGISPMGTNLRASHLRFARDDCRAFPLTPEQIAKGAIEDFNSTFVEHNPKADGRWFKSTELLADVPKVGKCWSKQVLGTAMRMNLTQIEGGI